MEGYRAHNSNTHYAFYGLWMCIMLYHKVSVSCMHFTFYKMIVVIIPFGCSVSLIML